MFCRQLCICALVSFVFLGGSSYADEPITIATWNVGFMDRNVGDLEIDEFLDEVDFDILLVNEVKKSDHLSSLKAAMDREAFHTAISSFSNGDGNLEVGIISRFPLDDIVEFDRSPDNVGISIDERRLTRVDMRGIANVGVGRGFLVAKVPMLNLYVIVTHLKSSRGASGNNDRSNAQKREFVAAAIAAHVQELREDDPDCTVVVGGDFNVGVSDSAKIGTNLTDDRGDGYDDTHHLLEGGVVDDLEMKSLAKEVESTFMGDDDIPDFPGTGAIDVLYAVGPLAEKFNPAKAASSRYGSDHLAVYAKTGSQEDEPEDGPDGGEPETGTVIIVNAMPNPEGSDDGNEQIVLELSDAETLDISGWTMRDRAGNIFSFPDGTTLNEGENTITLSDHTMPLNNSGDSVILLDEDGTRIGPIFQYSRDDVEPGEMVR